MKHEERHSASPHLASLRFEGPTRSMLTRCYKLQAAFRAGRRSADVSSTEPGQTYEERGISLSKGRTSQCLLLVSAPGIASSCGLRGPKSRSGIIQLTFHSDIEDNASQRWSSGPSSGCRDSLRTRCWTLSRTRSTRALSLSHGWSTSAAFNLSMHQVPGTAGPARRDRALPSQPQKLSVRRRRARRMKR